MAFVFCYQQAEVGGTEQTTLLTAQLSAHTHALQLTAGVQVSTSNPNSDEAAGGFLTNTSANFYATAGTAGNNLGGVSTSGTAAPTGGG